MKILQLKSENVKRLNCVEITPDGNLVIIAGENANGKTSVLDSIEMALGGGNAICERPLHKGAKKGSTTVDMGEIIVTRNYTAGGTTLTVAAKDGSKFSSPQTILDELVGKLTFDPLAFQRMKPEKQLDTLREMAGIDFTLLNAKHDRLYAERTDLNRDLKRVQGLLASLPHYKDAPTVEVSVAELSAQLKDAQSTNNANFEIRQHANGLQQDIDNCTRKYKDIEAEIKTLEDLLTALKAERETIIKSGTEARDAYETGQKNIAGLVDIDTAPILEQITNAEAINQKVRANVQYQDAESAIKAKEAKSAELTRQLEEIEEKKLNKIQSAQFPVEGLSLTDSGVTLNDLPFEQASGAEQLRVSVAIGMAANPKLKILLCRDGSLLDKKSLALLSEIVKENDYQLWLEQVYSDDPCAVVIENGYIKEESK